MIELQNVHSDPSFRSLWHNFCAIKREMILPPLCARVIKGGEFSGFWIERPKIASFETIAIGTSKGEIVGSGRATMFFGNNMLDFEGQ